VTPSPTESRPAPAARADCVLVADDLTGACDSAVHFAAAGFRTFVPLAPGRPDSEAQVLAFSTESRDVAAAAIPSRMLQLAAAVRSRAPRIVFKKIDSTLRGNTGFEIIAALDAFDCDAVVINPAFPAMGRVVESGYLRLTRDAAFQPVEIGAWLRAHGASSCRHVAAGAIGEAIDSGGRFLSIDAVCEADLKRLAAELLSERRRILWAGSAGLAGALSAAIGGVDLGTRVAAPAPGPVLFCIGSDHPVTQEQEHGLLAHREVAVLHACSTNPGELASALRGHVLLRIPRGRIEPPALAALFAHCRPAAFLLSGGDTAALVCQAIKAEGIELRREFLPGIPMGVLHGGLFDGAPVFTKSGGFGSPDDLIQLADYLHAC
jgi:uncharacterized protein YgbK (DUF1537 family)